MNNSLTCKLTALITFFLGLGLLSATSVAIFMGNGQAGQNWSYAILSLLGASIISSAISLYRKPLWGNLKYSVGTLSHIATFLVAGYLFEKFETSSSFFRVLISAAIIYYFSTAFLSKLAGFKHQPIRAYFSKGMPALYTALLALDCISLWTSWGIVGLALAFGICLGFYKLTTKLLGKTQDYPHELETNLAKPDNS